MLDINLAPRGSKSSGRRGHRGDAEDTEKTINLGMAIDNYYIADQFSLLSRLMDIHGENSFKSKSYAAAAFNIEKLPSQLTEIPAEKLASIKGIGDSTAKKVVEIIQTGKLGALQDLITKTPPGVLEMLNIKGLGPKKIATVWKEMEIESLGELLYACNENRLSRYKGFGEKTQKNVQDAIEFYNKNQGSHLYAEIEPYATAIDKTIKEKFGENNSELTGEFRRQLEIVDNLEWVTTAPVKSLKSFFETNNFKTTEERPDLIQVSGPENIRMKFHTTDKSDFYNKLFETSSSPEFMDSFRSHKNWGQLGKAAAEQDIFNTVGAIYLPAYYRERAKDIERKELGAHITLNDIKAIIHSHSTWSDGVNTIEEMAKACIAKGYEYLVISDHSKSAFYANGLSEERIKEQHKYIDELNSKYAPFKIFKSIECDILNDGSLDYSNNVLATFDLVITSIHSNLKMNEEKAMLRILNAVKNPFTTILGHMTGRLLLSRPGYPVDYKKVIDTCAENKVAIELNAHPRRLDIDWRWIDYALDKNVLISIDPDAHSVEGFEDCKYGVLVAQKAGVTKENNLSSFGLKEFEEYLKKRNSR